MDILKKRQRLDFPSYELPCSFGKIFMSPLSSTRIHVRTIDDAIRVNGIDYRVNTSLELYSPYEGEAPRWLPTMSDGWYIRKKDWTKYKEDCPTESARNKITVEITNKVVDFVDHNPLALTKAEWVRLNNEVSSWQEEEEKLLGQAEEARFKWGGFNAILVSLPDFIEADIMAFQETK